MRNSLKNRLTTFLRVHPDKWYPKGELCDLARDNAGYIGENTGRRLRELTDQIHSSYNRNIEVEYRKGHAYYRWKQSEAELFHKQMQIQ